MARLLARRLLAVAREAIRACHGGRLAREAVVGDGRACFLLAVGKGASAMARGVAGEIELESTLVITKDGHHSGFAAPDVEVRFAGHPLPDPRSAEAADAALRFVRGVPEGARLIVALSGGGSALLGAPLPGLSMGALARATRAMMAAGVGIDDINTVRRHLTRASGGRLARATCADVEVLVLSDVLSGDIAAIASGPFAPDGRTFADALALAEKIPDMGRPVLDVLGRGVRGELEETAKPGEPCFGRVRHRVLASHTTLRRAAEGAARARDFSPIILEPPSGNDVEVVAARMAELAARLEPGALVIAGGEPTVVLPPTPGAGGRNQQLALMVAERIAGERRLCFAAIASDGGDGPTDAAGAVVDERSWQMLASLGDPSAAIRGANANPILGRANMLVRTGPTGTNVLDLHLLAAL